MNEYMTQYFPNPDIILRTGGQYRLSNFLLWQSAYAELFFINELFPDLNVEILNNIIINYDTRTRNYGG
jgi:undecaprenyl diphosphate synthase